jgi:hypothetical protein
LEGEGSLPTLPDVLVSSPSSPPPLRKTATMATTMIATNGT